MTKTYSVEDPLRKLKAKVLKCVFSKKGKLLKVVPDTKAKSSKKAFSAEKPLGKNVKQITLKWLLDRDRYITDKAYKDGHESGYEQGKKEACKRIRHVLIDDDYLDQRISFFEWLADYEKGKELSKDG